MQCVSFYVILLLACLYVFYGNAKICYGDVRIQNDLRNIENRLKDCEIITGHLAIVLIDRPEISFTNYSFPKLVYILDYFIIFNVRNLISVGDLFPNLQMIQGNTTFEGYSFVVRHAVNLKELGLKNLQYIGRGTVRFGKSPDLCYVKTVNWTKLGLLTPPIIDEGEMPQNCSTCPPKCKDGCWSATECQETISNPRCIRDEGNCVEKCPDNKYILVPSSICVTEEECNLFPNPNPRFIFNGTCTLKCPRHYQIVYEMIDGIRTKTCEYCETYCKRNCSTINTKKDLGTLLYLEDLEGCTNIDGNLTIRTNQSNFQELERLLGETRTISHFLKIYRSNDLESLEFLKNLKEIKGEVLENSKALIVRDNPKLSKLWDINITKLRINRGGIMFHYNPQLCLSVIKDFAISAQIKLNNTDDVSPYSNGDQRMCTVSNLTITIIDIHPTNITLMWDPYRVVDDTSLVGYVIYYRESVGSMVNVYSDACSVDGWEPAFALNNSITLTNLKPYTNYTYYIKTSLISNRIKSSANSFDIRTNPQTKLHAFQTLSGDPSPPLNIQANSNRYDTITITWTEPESLKGNLSHYLIYAYKEMDDANYIYKRNYCRVPQVYTTPKTTKQNVAQQISTLLTCNEICIERNKSKLFNYDLFEDDHTLPDSAVYTFRSEILKHSALGGFEIRKRSESIPIAYHKYTIDRSVMFFEMTNLTHFTNYIFLVSACNENRTLAPQCSEVIMVYNRTNAKRDADDIKDFKIDIDGYNATIRWTEPAHPNSLILSYNVEYKRTDLDHSVVVPECVSRSKRSLVKQLSTGMYHLRLRAVSLAGPGRFTEYRTFTIYNPNSSTTTIVVIVVAIVIAIFVIVLFVLYRIKKRDDDKMPMVPNINPYYDAYIEDEWEVDRNDLNVDFDKELGQGTFGKVYNGTIKSKNLPCAIKTVNATADEDDRVAFLNEASVMKCFNEAHHVIRLLGVCSRGRPVYVIMELMPCGDLKTFLRRSRDSSQCITCNEMYRMAAQIADGMAYLAAKKFIHRDLAARNCMVAADHTIKIGDFGMARDIYESDYYRKESKGLLPVRWMAPESLADGVFTTDSDIWSYGVVLWEMVTLAEQPYQGLANEQVFQFVISRGTLERPSECPDLLYDIMKACWKWRPNSRPLFTNIIERLDSHVGQNFQFVSFFHSREGEEYRMIARERPFNPPAMAAVSEAAEAFAHYSVSDENVSIYSGETSRPSKYLSIPHQRQSRLSSLNIDEDSSPINGYSSYPLSP